MNIVFLSCTKSKLPYKSKAKDLYSESPMFSKTLQYGQSLKPDKMFILSAKHHLVDLDQVLEPYDLTLKDFKKEEREIWANKVISQLNNKGININKNKFIFLAGSAYIKPLSNLIPEQNIIDPMNGLKMGERLQWLNSKISQIKEYYYNIKKLVNEIIKRKFK